MKRVIMIVFLLGLISCAPIRVNYDYDQETNFSTYKTYNYYSDMKTGLSELDTKRFLEALDAKLETLGITYSETPDFFIDIKSDLPNILNVKKSNILDNIINLSHSLIFLSKFFLYSLMKILDNNDRKKPMLS